MIMEVEYSGAGEGSWVRKRWFEFRQGHGTYLGFFLSFTNFVLISYNLLLEQVFPDLPLLQFCIIFGSLYVPTSIIIGKWHLEKQVKYDIGMTVKHNPGIQAVLREIRVLKKTIEESPR